MISGGRIFRCIFHGRLYCPIRAVIVITALLFSSEYLRAQQYAGFSQYSFNHFLINPAAAGSDGYTTLQLISRSQWLGIEGAPGTQAFNAQFRLFKGLRFPFSKSVRHKYASPKKSGNTGFGAQIINDRSGAFCRTGIQFTYAYHFKVKRSRLSAGTTLNLHQLKIDEKKIRTQLPDLNLLAGSQLYSFVTDLNFGIYYYSKNSFGGLSVNNITNIFNFFDPYDISSYNQRVVSLIGGYRITPSDRFCIEPAVYLKSTDLTAIQGDINIRLLFYESYWTALVYRSNHGISCQAGAKIGKYYIGYAFDYYFVNIEKFSNGTHEVMVAAKFGDNQRRYRWLDRY